MGLLQRWLGHARRPEWPAELAARLAAWESVAAADPALRPGRYVLLDIATDGLDPAVHTVQSLAALGLRQGVVAGNDVILLDSLPELARQGEYALQHALLDVLEHVAADPVVTWQSGFVGAFVQALYRAQLGIEWAPPWLDLAVILPELFPDAPVVGQHSFDAWLALFGIALPGRLAALPDAIGMARLLQVALAEAARRGCDSWPALHDIERQRRWLGK
ncbi:MAG TPA: hypothetical protein PLW86_13710 [Rhodocyclaceae bacterium]|nr:hypothetical protein [Rhodocyclaceae bacterium]